MAQCRRIPISLGTLSFQFSFLHSTLGLPLACCLQRRRGRVVTPALATPALPRHMPAFQSLFAVLMISFRRYVSSLPLHCLLSFSLVFLAFVSHIRLETFQWSLPRLVCPSFSACCPPLWSDSHLMLFLLSLLLLRAMCHIAKRLSIGLLASARFSVDIVPF